MIVRIGLSLCALALVVALVGCSDTGKSGITQLDSLTATNGTLFRVANNGVTAATAANGQVTITTAFTAAVDDDTVIAGKTMNVSLNGETVTGTFNTGTTVDDATVLWVSDEPFIAGSTFVISFVGQEPYVGEGGSADAVDGDSAVVSLTGMPLQGGVEHLQGDGNAGANYAVAVTAN